MSESHLFHAAKELAEAANHAADEFLPGRLAEIVKLHAAIAVGAALIPIPGADIAAAGANIWTMYVRINKELELPFSENVIKSVAAGIATNIGGTVAVFLIGGSILKFIPGLGTLGGAAVVGATIYGVTIAAGIVYMKAVSALLRRKAAGDITGADLAEQAEKEMRDKEALKDIIKSAKKDYKDD